MSHFTKLNTSFKSVVYLTYTLDKLDIPFRWGDPSFDPVTQTSRLDMVIPSTSISGDPFTGKVQDRYQHHTDVAFRWNGQEYELVFDESFWNQTSSVKKFISKLSTKYAEIVVINESGKLGFNPMKIKKYVDGSYTITLRRWKKSVSPALTKTFISPGIN